MPKRKNLNGIPNNIVQQYFSTLFCYDRGYMADWIWFYANKYGIWEIEIDIFRKTVNPSIFETTALTAFLDQLQNTIKLELKSNKFPSDYISSAKLIIAIPETLRSQRLLNCIAIIEDVEGKVYSGKMYSEKAFELR